MLHFRQDESTKGLRVVKTAAWRRNIVTTDAGRIETLDIGTEQAGAILLMTHGLGSVHSMEEIAEGLSTRYPGRRIVAYSRPGRGASPQPADITAEDLLAHEALNVVPALMRALGLTTVDLVAHSDGVAVALLFACTHPWMVRRIVAVCPQVHADSHFISATGEMLAEGQYRDDIDTLCAEHEDAHVAVKCWSAARQSLAVHPGTVLDHVKSLAAPLLLIQGLKDRHGAHAQMEALSERVHGPMKWVMLRQDGHFLQHDNAEVVLDMICGHLGEATPQTASGHRRFPTAV